MSQTISRCGIDCTICPWSKTVQDSMSEEEYEELKGGCKNIIGFAPSKSFQNCLGCMTPDDDIPKDSPIPLKSCKVRKCTLTNCIDNCAYCSRFPCGRYIENRTIEWNRERTEQKLQRSLTNHEYNTFVKCWEAEDRLTAFRETLTSEQLKDPIIMPPLKNPVKKLPELNVSSTYLTSLKFIHQIIEEIYSSTHQIQDTDVFIQQERLKSQIEEILRFLWIMGTFSSIDQDTKSLVINAKNFLENRKGASSLGVWAYLDKSFRKLIQNLGVTFELKPETENVKKKDWWLMDSGYLRKKNWELHMKFSKEKGGFNTLRVFHEYLQKLNEKYGNRTFGYFKKADMRVYKN